jgi:hypothetical protein
MDRFRFHRRTGREFLNNGRRGDVHGLTSETVFLGEFERWGALHAFPVALQVGGRFRAWVRRRG